MNTSRCHTDKHIPILKVLTCDDVLLINDTYCKTCKIILFLRHKTWVLCCLATYKGAA